MNSSSPLPLAALFDFDFSLQPHMVAIVVPVVAIIFGCTIALAGMYFQHQKKRLLHDTARLALEKGQPLPTDLLNQLSSEEVVEKPAAPRKPSDDIRTGLILIAVGVGIYLFFEALSVEKMRFAGAIPGLIGVALLIFGAVSAALARNKSDSAPRS